MKTITSMNMKSTNPIEGGIVFPVMVSTMRMPITAGTLIKKLNLSAVSLSTLCINRAEIVTPDLLSPGSTENP